MAIKKKTKKKAGAKVKSTSSKAKTSSVVAKVKKAGSSIVSAVTGSKSKGTGRRRRRGALWYAKEIQRLKLKKRYEKIKYRV